MSNPTFPPATPAFLDHGRPPVPDVVVPRGVQPFHLREKPVRGRLVRLGPLAEALLGRHPTLHSAILTLTGEAMALTAALASALKFKGSFSLQAKGDGAVPMLLADCTDGGALRGYARAEPAKLEALMASGAPSAKALLGDGYLAFTCDQGPDMERYQGIVAIEGETLAAMTGTYFRTSEQLRSQVHLACANTPDGWRASALVIERVAAEGGAEPKPDDEAHDDAWETAQALAATITPAELLNDALTGERLLHRLFHAEGLVVDRPRTLSYGCRCSRARLAQVLEGFPDGDLDYMVKDGAIVMTCEFCNLDFRFARTEVEGKAGRA
jgi:molecular chaperone Hsp33